jgi:MraZ protein
MDSEPTKPADSLITGMGVFFSNHTHALDPKKRLTIPSEWRLQIGIPSGLFVMPDLQSKCLRALAPAEMVRRLEILKKQALSDPKARKFMRQLGSQSELVGFDSQGRIRIKDELLAHAHLESDVLMVGAVDSIEFWNPELYQDAGGASRENYAEEARRIGF